MQQQRSIVHTEQISRRGEIKYFQIPLQGTAIKIIGVEVSAFQLLDQALSVPFWPAPLSFSLFALSDVVEEVNGDGGGGGSAGSSGSSGIGTSGSTLNNCPNPGSATIDPVSSNTVNGITTQVFRIGTAVNPNFIYRCGVYSVVMSLTAVDGDTPISIAFKLASAVNNTSLSEWNQFGSNDRNYKPTANANGDLLTLTVDSQHSFFATGFGSCQPPPPPPVQTPTPPPPQPPPPPPSPPELLQYDPLFFINNNEKVGYLSLQSPDATDIFLQCEAYREDKNINWGDYSYPQSLVGEWLKGRKRIETDVSITTSSPILEAYYKDCWGEYYGKDITYSLNIFIWFEKLVA